MNPLPAEFMPWVRVEYVQGDSGRKRIELARETPVAVARRALDHAGKCVACGRRVAYFRQRTPPGNKRNPAHPRNIYVAVTCELGPGTFGCARGGKARDAYKEIVADVESGHWPPPQLPLGP